MGLLTCHWCPSLSYRISVSGDDAWRAKNAAWLYRAGSLLSIEHIWHEQPWEAINTVLLLESHFQSTTTLEEPVSSFAYLRLELKLCICYWFPQTVWQWRARWIAGVAWSWFLWLGQSCFSVKLLCDITSLVIKGTTRLAGVSGPVCLSGICFFAWCLRLPYQVFLALWVFMNSHEKALLPLSCSVGILYICLSLESFFLGKFRILFFFFELL